MSANHLDVSMLELFRMEAESQTAALTSGLLALEHDAAAPGQLDLCMRAAHSLKGAARIVGLDAGVRVAHAMEDHLVASQNAQAPLTHDQIDRLLGGADLLAQIAIAAAESGSAQTDEGKIDAYLKSLADAFSPGAKTGANAHVQEPPPAPVVAPPPTAPPPAPVATAPAASAARESGDRVLRVTAENLNRLLGLAGESLVEAGWVKPFAESLLRLKRMQHETTRALDRLRETLTDQRVDERAQTALADAQRLAHECEQALGQRLAEVEMFDRRSYNLSHRLYDEAISCRMRPFADGVQGFPRMVRDLARTLGKDVRFEIVGENTQVDRDILASLDAPLGHILRNALDHGLEPPADRLLAGKPARGVLTLEARHSAGVLQIIVSDDGRGVDLDKLREAVVARNLASQESAAAFSEAELLEFLFLPGFTMKSTVTDISGRGVGLDVVRDMVKQVRGTVRLSSQPGKGAKFILQLPVSLSVVRTLLAEIGGEPYAFPLAYIVRTLKLPKDKIEFLEGRQHFGMDNRRIGLITARQVLSLEDAGEPPAGDELPVVVLGDESHAYGLVVDRFLGERELVVQPLDPQLGKIKDISAAALMDDGAPVLIVDTEDLIRSMEKLVSAGHLNQIARGGSGAARKARKRVLVVDDSLTVRELERKLLANNGYDVEVAVDGMDGWNAVRTGHFDLVVTDIDMPRMDGIQLVGLITHDANLKSVPVMIVSYKDREEDRRRGFEAGAAHYLTKGSFHDESLLQAVVDLIGEAAA